MNTRIVKAATLTAVLALMAGCAEDPPPRSVGPAAAVAFDGTWSGAFDAADVRARDGVSCGDGRASFDVAGGRLSGEVLNRFGTFPASGTVGSGGSVSGSYMAPGGPQAGSFTARMSAANEMEGSFTDRYGCSGTFVLRRL
jgi:hypothetical protein